MILKDKPESSSFVQIGEGYSQIASGPNSITTTKDAGNFIQGPTSFSSAIENIKVGGIFRFNPMLSTGIPSTMVTPMPVLTIDLPIGNIAIASQIAAISTNHNGNHAGRNCSTTNINGLALVASLKTVVQPMQHTRLKHRKTLTATMYIRSTNTKKIHCVT